MQQPSSDPQALWSVIRVEDTTIFGGPGGASRGKRVYFKLPDRSESFVEVPLSEFTQDRVARLIDDHVANLLDVMNLRGPDLPPQLG